MSNTDQSLSLANPHPTMLNSGQKYSLLVGVTGLFLFFLVFFNVGLAKLGLLTIIASILCFAAVISYTYFSYKNTAPGIKNNGVFLKALTNRGTIAWIVGIVITAFYICLYWFPNLLDGLIKGFDPLSNFLRNSPADQWFVYGAFYTIAVLAFGIKFIIKYRHNKYQIIRTISVMFFQLGFAFLLPAFMKLMNQPEFYFSYFWPLDSYSLRPGWIADLYSKGGIGLFLILFSVMMTFIATPILTYFYGKRWYCSWVCGCGGLAETAGDSFRQLSNKSLTAWKIERWMIHLVLVFVVLTTGLLWLNSAYGGSILKDASGMFSKSYGFLIASMFSGVIGVGFYPILGSRVWCRFGCPMAALLGLQQKFFSRFRITTNGGQCISCGNCSTYCEMGIDVRWYAQRGENIVRSSCVGCGVCAAVCPRGVLRLENGPVNEERKRK